MDHPVGGLALGDQGVQGPGGDPHDVAAGLVVLGVLHGDPAAVDQGAHEALHEVVGGGVVLPGEVLLGDVVHDVIDPRHHLIVGEGIGVLRVQDGELGEDLLAKHMADLQLGGVVGDDRAAVHLRPRTHHGEHAPHGDELVVRVLHPQVVLFPGVLIAPGGDGDRLGIVAAGAAAHRQQQVHVVLPGDLAALVELFHRGVGHDAGVLEDLLAGGLQDGHHLVIDAVFLDGPAAVDQLDLGPVVGQLPRQGVHGVGAEVEFGGVAVGEVA